MRCSRQAFPHSSWLHRAKRLPERDAPFVLLLPSRPPEPLLRRQWFSWTWISPTATHQRPRSGLSGQLRSSPCLGSLGTLLATNLLDIESRLLREQTRNLFARSAIQAEESIYIFSPSRPTASRMPWRRACGRGGHPGMYTSTGTTLSTPPREA